MSEGSVTKGTSVIQAEGGGVIPAPSLHFFIGLKDEACGLVKKYHYSHRLPAGIGFVGSFHISGGLFGNRGEMVAAAIFSQPSARWKDQDNMLELIRLVRKDGIRCPLTKLISLCVSALRKRKYDLLVSYADSTHGHEGYVYRASGWNYHGQNNPCMDGLIIDGEFIPGRTCNAIYGTRSPVKLKRLHSELD